MGAQTTAGPRKGAGRTVSKPKLPPVTVAKLEETGTLLERLVDENQSVFIDRANGYREMHREKTSRPLTPAEAAQIAAVLADTERDPVELAQTVQQGTLRAYDEPAQREILLSAGVAAAPAFVHAVRRIVALVEMPAGVFEEACDDGTLAEQIDAGAGELRKLELADGRARASAAFEHYAQAAGFKVGEVWRLPVQAVWQALGNSVSGMADSVSSQLIDSAASTADSAGPTSSTGSPG